MNPRFAWFCLAALAGSFSGCALHSAPERPFSVVFSAATDEGEPLSGVTFAFGEQTLGTTDSAGNAEHSLAGAEGKMVKLSVSCPAGFELGEAPASLRLTRIHRVETGEPKPLLYRTTCARRIREVVVVVRSERGSGLPVEIDGKAAGTTDPDGTAHILIGVDRGARAIGVGLDTRARLDLRPQNPSRTFELTGRDAVLVFDQGFTAFRPVSPRRTAIRARHVPYRVD